MAKAKEALQALQALAKALGKSRAVQGVDRSTIKGSKLAELYRSLGPETLYRHEGPGASLTQVGESVGRNTSAYMHTTEPRGKYFGRYLRDVPELLEPEDPDVIGEATTDFGRTREAAQGLTGYDKGLIDRGGISKEFIRARMLPNTRHLDASDPSRWEEVLKEYRSTLPKKDRDKFLKIKTIDGGVELVGTDYFDTSGIEDNSKYAKGFTNWLRKKYDAVTFPDAVLGQDTPQTVLLNKGKAVGRHGNRYRILGLLAALDKLQNSSGDDDA